MDESASDFIQTSGGCNYCDVFLSEKANSRIGSDIVELLDNIKSEGSSDDCIVGVSGGVDSSWVLVKAVELGLRPLAVHMDNTWNSALASSNIRNLTTILNVDLLTYVIDWNEYKAMLSKMLSADVVDIELLYDNALYGVNYYYSRKHGIRHLLGGMNMQQKEYRCSRIELE